MRYLYLIAGLFGLDYMIKEEIEAQEPETFPRDLERSGGKIRLYRNHNQGFCFGIQKEHPELVRQVPVIFTSASAGILVWLLTRRKPKKTECIGFSLITAGALSNLLDRLKRGYVVDYFSIRVKYLEKIVWNLGDFFILAGSALLGVSELASGLRETGRRQKAGTKGLRWPWRKQHLEG